MKTRIFFLLFLLALAARSCPGQTAASPSDETSQPRQMLAATLSRLLEDAIPLQYEKQKDWGATAEIPAGWRITGKPFHWHSAKREHTVNHGVWKHYKLRMIEPAQNLHVMLEPLRPIGPNRVAFTLHLDAAIDAWARAKVYEYGVHVIALEMESDMRVRVVVEGELGIEMRWDKEGAGLAVVPVVTNSHLDIDGFNLRRVSNAKGPLVHELGDGVRKLVEDELNGPKLTEKLNKAIEKKRDRLAFRPADLIDAKWWPLAEWSAASVAPSSSVSQ